MDVPERSAFIRARTSSQRRGKEHSHPSPPLPMPAFSRSEPQLKLPRTPRKLNPKKSAAAIVRRAAAFMRSPPARTKTKSPRVKDSGASQKPMARLNNSISRIDPGYLSPGRLVLPRDDVSFSASAFFRRVNALSTNSGARTSRPPRRPVPTLEPSSSGGESRPWTELQVPPTEPSERPMADRPPILASTSLLPPPSIQCNPPRNTRPSGNASHDFTSAKSFETLAELQAMSLELTELRLLDSPPPAPPRIRPPAPHDPLSQLMAVAQELQDMEPLDSDEPLPLSPQLPRSLVSFLEVACLAEPRSKASQFTRRIVEMEVFAQPFNGAEVPSIVVTQPDEASAHSADSYTLISAAPSADLLGPPPTNSRGRVDVVPPLPPPPPSPDVEAIFLGDFPYAPLVESFVRCDCAHCIRACEPDIPWDPLSLLEDLPPTFPPVAPLAVPPPPVRPPPQPFDFQPTPKPPSTLLRRKSTLLQRVLPGRNVDTVDAPEVKAGRPSLLRRAFTRKRSVREERVEKERIGPPRPLTPGFYPAVSLVPPLGPPWEPSIVRDPVE